MLQSYKLFCTKTKEFAKTSQRDRHAVRWVKKIEAAKYTTSIIFSQVWEQNLTACLSPLCSKVNERREPRIFEEFAYHMIDIARKKRIDKDFEIDGKVFAFDSTTIDLCLSVFWWAKFRRAKAGIKVGKVPSCKSGNQDAYALLD